jgi:hypothetical protein
METTRMTSSWRSMFLSGVFLAISLMAAPQLAARAGTPDFERERAAHMPVVRAANLPAVNAPASPANTAAVNAPAKRAAANPAGGVPAGGVPAGIVPAANPVKGGQPAAARASALSTTVRDGVEAYSLYVPYINQMTDTDPALNGDCACGPTSVAMVLAYFGRVGARPSAAPNGQANPYGWVLTDSSHTYGKTAYDRRIAGCAGSGEFGGLYGAVMNNGWELLADWQRVTDALESHGLTVRVRDEVDFDTVKAALDKGHPVILTTRGLTGWGHLIVVTGYTADGRLVVNDSFGSKWDEYPNDNGEGVLYAWEDLGLVRYSWEVSGPGEGWQAEYYDARGALFLRSDRDLNFDWGRQAPGAPLDATAYSARWTRSAYFAKGLWTLSVRTDGDIRVRVDSKVVLELANQPGAQARALRLPLAAGTHALQVEYRHAAGEPGVVQVGIAP